MVRTAFTIIALILLVAAGPQIAYVFFLGNSHTSPVSSQTPVAVRGALLDSSLDEAHVDENVSSDVEVAQAPMEEPVAARDLIEAVIEEVNTADFAEAPEPADSSPAVKPIGTRGPNGILRLTFDELASFDYVDYSQQLSFDINEYEVDGQIPESYMALNGETVEVEGFMLPVDVEGGKVSSFILTNSTLLCCFGIMPNLNEWMWVEMEEGQFAEWHNNIPIKVRGKIEVGEEIEDGIVISLYRMSGQRAGLPHQF